MLANTISFNFWLFLLRHLINSILPLFAFAILHTACSTTSHGQGKSPILNTPQPTLNFSGPTNGPGLVSLSCPDEQASIFYSFNTNDQWVQYKTPFPLPGQCELYFFAKSGSSTPSSIQKRVFSITRREPLSFREVGAAMKSVSCYTGFFDNSSERPIYYGCTNSGTRATLFRFDSSNAIVDWQVPLDSVSGAWELIKLDNTLYAATYYPARLYSVNIQTGHAEKLLEIKDESEIMSMTLSGDYLYLGTYPNATLIRFNINDKSIKNYGRISSQKYIRSLSTKNSKIYAGIGAKSELIEIDENTGSMTQILPPELQKDSFVFKQNIIDNHIFLGMSPSYDIIDYNTTTGSFTTLLSNSKFTHIFDTPSFGEGISHFCGIEGILFEYNSRLKTLKRMTPPDSSPNFWANGTHIYKNRIIGTLSQGLYFEMDFSGKITRTINLLNAGLAGVNVKPYSMASYNNWVYLGERWLKCFSLPKGKEFLAAISGEAKCLAIYDNALITCNYGGAYIYKVPLSDIYDDNTLKDFRSGLFLFGQGGKGQNRPLDITKDMQGDHLFLCSEPDYGTYGGALWVHDLKASKSTAHTNIVPNHTPHAVCPSRNKDEVIIGTSIYGGTGSQPLNESPNILRYNFNSQKVIWKTSIEKAHSILQIINLKKDMLALLNTGVIISLDPINGQLIKEYTLPAAQKLIKSITGELYVLCLKGLYKYSHDDDAFSMETPNFSAAYNVCEDPVSGTIFVLDGYQLLACEWQH